MNGNKDREDLGYSAFLDNPLITSFELDISKPGLTILVPPFLVRYHQCKRRVKKSSLTPFLVRSHQCKRRVKKSSLTPFLVRSHQCKKRVKKSSLIRNSVASIFQCSMCTAWHTINQFIVLTNAT